MISQIECVSSRQAVSALVEPLLREYLTWVVDRFAKVLGTPFEDPDALVERHDAMFRGKPQVFDASSPHARDFRRFRSAEGDLRCQLQPQ